MMFDRIALLVLATIVTTSLLGQPPRPPRCWLGHDFCKDGHPTTPPDTADWPVSDRPKSGACYYGCPVNRLWYAPHMGGRNYCRKHLRAALKAGGYPISEG